MTISLIIILLIVLQSSPRAIGIQEEINVFLFFRPLLIYTCICMLELGRISYYCSFSNDDLRGSRSLGFVICVSLWAVELESVPILATFVHYSFLMSCLFE